MVKLYEFDFSNEPKAITKRLFEQDMPADCPLMYVTRQSSGNLSPRFWVRIPAWYFFRFEKFNSYKFILFKIRQNLFTNFCLTMNGWPQRRCGYIKRPSPPELTGRFIDLFFYVGVFRARATSFNAVSVWKRFYWRGRLNNFIYRVP